MKSWKVSPKKECVANYVDCYWFLEKESHDRSLSHPKLNPDYAPHLIISRSEKKFKYAYGDKIQNVNGSHLIFPHIKTFTMDHSDPFSIVGVKFKVWALYSLGINNLVSRLDRVETIDVGSIVSSIATDIETILNNSSELDQKMCNTLDDGLVPWLSGCHEDKNTHLVRQVMLLLGDIAIADIGTKLHRSQRTIERIFRRVTGLSMKQVQSMIRFEEILDYLYRLDKEDISWIDVANEFGFSDQPHLVRYIKSAIGKTPSTYVVDRDLTIDVYGNFELD